MMILRCIHQNGIEQDATHRRRWSVRVAVLLLPLLTLASLLACDESRADVALAKCSGTLSEEQGVRVLRLWGTPREQGHAHGLLLGPHIVGMMRQLLDGPVLFNDPREYELGIREQLLPRLRQTEAEREELAGMLEGIRERVGKNELMLKRMKRPIDALDLFAVNTLADWIPGACSSFAAWGKKTRDGGTVVGRNLDYFNLPGLRKLHLVIVRKNTDSEASGWVSIAWPGLIGAYTAMNEHGVVAAMHNVDGFRMKSEGQHTPRSYVLRKIIETTNASNALEQAEKILQAEPATRGNNFLIAVPSTDATSVAAVFEYDARMQLTKGLTVRGALVADQSSEANFIACTNHYRSRENPDESCWRYRKIMATLNDGGEPIDSKTAWKIMASVAVNNTIHSMVAFPNQKEFELKLATPGDQACHQQAKRFSLATLLK